MMSLFSMIFIGIANIEQPFLMHQPEMTERRERQKVHVCLFKRGYNSNRDCENSVQVQSWEVFTNRGFTVDVAFSNSHFIFYSR